MGVRRDEIKKVPISELANKPENYHLEIIELTGYYNAGFEISAFREFKHGPREDLVWLSVADNLEVSLDIVG